MHPLPLSDVSDAGLASLCLPQEALFSRPRVDLAAAPVPTRAAVRRPVREIAPRVDRSGETDVAMLARLGSRESFVTARPVSGASAAWESRRPRWATSSSYTCS